MELPDDLLVDVLRRLPPRPRHGTVRPQLLARHHRHTPPMHLLPLPLAGILINFNGHRLTELFAHPSPAPVTVSSKFHHYLPDAARDFYDAIIMDHCNGLLLLSGGYVVNPATRQWAKLPCPRPPFRYGKEHFWTNGWEERSFQRQGESFSTVADLPWSGDPKSAVYWRGDLYVHHYFVMRISLSSGKYQVIKPPQDINSSRTPKLQLGRSEKGVYLASIASHAERLQVWILDESSARLEWVLKYQADIRHILSHRGYNPKVQGSWVMEDSNYHSYHDRFPDYKEQAPPENGFEWDSDNEDVLDTKDKVDGECREYVDIIGFHPQKEVVFLSESLERGFAYHLSTSKLQDLGYMYPTQYDEFAEGDFKLRAEKHLLKKLLHGKLASARRHDSNVDHNLHVAHTAVGGCQPAPAGTTCYTQDAPRATGYGCCPGSQGPLHASRKEAPYHRPHLHRGHAPTLKKPSGSGKGKGEGGGNAVTVPLGLPPNRLRTWRNPH
uniref:F-box associated domain-containing protein n=1 Tax=Aegilops tauschii TaxID=37682 RepID=M8C1Q4_AEGTA